MVAECSGDLTGHWRGVCGSNMGCPAAHPFREGLRAIVHHRLDLGEYFMSDAIGHDATVVAGR